jgi:hypothetical protein
MTNSEAIRELEKSTASLIERVDNLQEDGRRDREATQRIAETVRSLENRLLLVEERLAELKKLSEENDRRRWQLALLLLASVLTLIVNIALVFVRK